MARSRQVNVRLTEGELACLEAVRGHHQSQADAIAQLVILECERRWHYFGQTCDEEHAARFANALWLLDHEDGRQDTGRPPRPIKPQHPVVP